MISKLKTYQVISTSWVSLLFALTVAIGIPGRVDAQTNGTAIVNKEGAPTELARDRSSETLHSLNLSGCCLNPSANPKDQLQIQLTSDLETSLFPVFIDSSKGRFGNPVDTLKKCNPQELNANPEAPISNIDKPKDQDHKAETGSFISELLEIEEDQEVYQDDMPLITASGTFSETMSGPVDSSNPMGTTFELTADFSAGTIKGTLKGGRTSTPGGWMNCKHRLDPSVELDRIDLNTAESYEASFSGSIDKKTGEFSIPIMPNGGTSATKVSLFTHEDCLQYNADTWPGEHGWNGEGTISGTVSKDGGIVFATSWNYSWHFGEVQVSGRWSGSGIVENQSEEEVEELSLAIACTPKQPKIGGSVSCTASVNGVQEGESLEFQWFLDGVAGSRSQQRTFTWEGKEARNYEVGLQVFGEERSVRKTLGVNVLEEEVIEEEPADTPAADVDQVSSLVSTLESLLRSAGFGNINPTRVAAAGTAVTSLIAIWMITNHRAGVPMDKLEQALGRWRWREGQKTPADPSKVDIKNSSTHPKTLPEIGKVSQESKPPSTLPERVPEGGSVKASASAELDKAAQVQQEAGAGASVPQEKAVSGETGEERVERAVDDLEGYRDAVDKTLTTFDEKLKKVPDKIKASKFWKEKVAPQLKKLDELKIKEKSAKLKEFLRITKDLIQVRNKVDAKLSGFSKEDREGVIWLVRGLQVGEETLKTLHQRMITDPAIAAAKAALPKEQAQAAEKILKQHQADIEQVLKGIKNLPIDFGNVVEKGQHRDQITGIIKKDMNNVYDSKWKQKYKPDFSKGLEKVKPIINSVEEGGSSLEKWLGKHLVYFNEIPPAP